MKCEIEDHPVVNIMGFLAASGKNKVDVYANSRCYAVSLDESSRITATSASLQRNHDKLSHQQSNQGHSRHHAREGAHDERKNHVAHSSGSVLVSHVLQEGVARGSRKYTD